MANEEHLAILRQGVEVWIAWRKANPDVQPDLQAENPPKARAGRANLEGANLRAVDLHEVDLRGAFLEGANLEGANLHEADLRGAYLEGAYLEGAILAEANLREADLYMANLLRASLNGADLYMANLAEVNLRRASLDSANLRGASLTVANLHGASLHRANLKGARLHGTIFADNDLSNIKGLDEVIHLGPSTIGIDTLVKSKGKISEAFLRGCGVPNSLIEYLPSLLGAMEPIQFYSCFISYSTKDEAFAKRIHSKMRDNNLRVWFANEDLKGGYKLHEQIDEAIRVYDKFIIVLSPESLRSKWVMNEVRRTRKAELANNQRKFFPIALMDYGELEDWECLDPETGMDLAAEIREYYVPDFRDWKNHDSFEKAFAQLLGGLKAVDAPPAPRIEPKPKPKDIPQEPEKIIARMKQRLAILEEQAAIYGIDVRPHIATEIEYLRREIEKLNRLY